MRHLEIQGVSVPRLGAGTFQLADRDCEQAVTRALEIGYRLIDTAEAYGNEREVGAAIRGSGIPRDEIFVTTKVWRENLRFDELARHLDGSLERLGTPWVDLLLIHWPDEDLPLEEPLQAMQTLQQERKIRLFGVSNFPPQLVQRAAAIAPIACNQVEYHPYLSQAALRELAVRHGHALMAYCPLARGQVADDPVLQEIGRAHDRTPAQIALAWLLQQPQVVAIPKAADEAHLQENFAVTDIELTAAEMTRIDNLQRDLRLIDPDFAPRWRRREARE